MALRYNSQTGQWEEVANEPISYVPEGYSAWEALAVAGLPPEAFTNTPLSGQVDGSPFYDTTKPASQLTLGSSTNPPTTPGTYPSSRGGTVPTGAPAPGYEWKYDPNTFQWYQSQSAGGSSNNQMSLADQLAFWAGTTGASSQADRDLQERIANMENDYLQHPGYESQFTQNIEFQKLQQQNLVDYQNNLMAQNYQLAQETNALEQQRITIQKQYYEAQDANTKEQLRQSLMQLESQIAQNKAELEQRQLEFGETHQLAQQAQDWLQQYQGGQLDLERSGQQIAQNNYLANMAANPINWMQYNEAAGNPSVAQPFMEQLGGPAAGTVLGQNPSATSYQNYTAGTGYQASPSVPQGAPSGAVSSMDTFTNWAPGTMPEVNPYPTQYYDASGNIINQQSGTFGAGANLFDPTKPQLGTISPTPRQSAVGAVNPSIPGTRVSGAPNTMGLPQLQTPGAQTYAKFTPTEQDLYAGYERARTGATEADTLYKMMQLAPPKAAQTLSYRY